MQTIVVANVVVKATPTVWMTFTNLVKAADARREAFARTGRVSPDSEESREFSRLARDMCGLMNFTVTEAAIRDWVI